MDMVWSGSFQSSLHLIREKIVRADCPTERTPTSGAEVRSLRSDQGMQMYEQLVLELQAVDYAVLKPIYLESASPGEWDLFSNIYSVSFDKWIAYYYVQDDPPLILGLLVAEAHNPDSGLEALKRSLHELGL